MDITEKQKMKSITVEIYYPGNVISVNHYKYYGGLYTKPGAKMFKDELGWLIKTSHIEDWQLPLKVHCDGRFKDKRSQPDLSNLSKVILDAIEETTGVNDKNYRWQDGEVSYGEPTLWITIEEILR